MLFDSRGVRLEPVGGGGGYLTKAAACGGAMLAIYGGDMSTEGREDGSSSVAGRTLVWSLWRGAEDVRLESVAGRGGRSSGVCREGGRRLE